MRSVGWLIAAVMTLVCLALWMQLTGLRKTVSELRIQAETAKPLVRRARTNADQNASSSGIAGSTVNHVIGAIERKHLSLAEVLNDHPEYSPFWRRILRRQLLKDNVDMFSHLKIAPEKLEKLKDMMVEQRLSVMDAVDAATRNGIEPISPEMAEVRKRAQDQSNLEIASMLGPEDFSEWRHATAVQAFQTNEAVQDIVIDTRDMGEPMTDEQTWKLKEAFQANSSVSYGANLPDPNSGLRPSEHDQLTRAAQFLSPTQVQALRDIFVQFHQREAMFQSLGPFMSIGW